MKTVEIKNIKELFKYIKKWNVNYDCWFRGQSNANFLLTPAAIRPKEMILWKDQYGRLYRPQMVSPDDKSPDTLYNFSHDYLEEFKKEITKSEIIKNLEIDNELELLCLGQHYGLITKLLDWSTDATVALFFAVNEYKEENTDAAFFIFKPLIWNKKITDISKIFSSEELIEILENDTLISRDFPVAFSAKKISKRICRQSGYFTEHNFLVTSFDKMYDTEDSLIKIIIPYDLKCELYNILKILGINKESIYVEKEELDVITKKVKELVNRIKEKKIEEFNKEYEEAPEDMKKEYKIYSYNF